MKTTRITATAMAAALVAAIVVSGCKKDEEPETATKDIYQSDREMMYDNSIAESSFDDAGNVADEGVTGSLETYRLAGVEKVLTSCASITLDTVTVPHSVQIDFGPTDCLCKDGNYRRGIIQVEWMGHYRDSGATHTITFIDYYLNFNKIDGTKAVTNDGHNAAGNLSFSISVTGSVTIDPQYSYNGTGGTITFTSSRTREWIAGEGTLIWWDDIYLIGGTSQGTTTGGLSYSMSTQAGHPLKKEIGFLHFTDGILDIAPTGKPVRTIDYGYLNGNRDNLAMFSISGFNFVIYLGKK